MPKKKTRIKPGKHRTLFDYISITDNKQSPIIESVAEKQAVRAEPEQPSENRVSETSQGVEQGGLEEQADMQVEQQAENGDAGGSDTSMDELFELLSILETKKKTTDIKTKYTSTSKPGISPAPAGGLNIEIRGSIMDVDLGQLELPTGGVLEDILEKGLGKDDVICYSDGRCSDGINVGEIYTDKYGFRRQRGYVNTTRIPVYTDWIVEEGVVKPILARAYGLKTNRGAVALVPEDFLCELEARYGIKLLNYDKCKGYKPILEWGSRSSRRKRKK